ncbi:MAG TPA: biotin--[acetyl-CoA-carboxylase] ligase [Draconibacterium sp.]|nr:biotin--[acetyl-CoA-carboxylase] ligase [Draconibacterium sp.]
MTNKKIIFLTEVESTNNYANQLVLSKAAEHGTVVLAQYQNKGKGQQGNSWESEPGKNLLASIILFPDFLSASKQFYLSKIASLSIVDFLKSETNGITIKWPNDIYIQNKKVAGILIENAVKGQNLSSSIIGIGLNLNQERFVSNAPNPVSLKQVSAKHYEIENVSETIFENMRHWYQILKNGDFDEIDLAYFNQLYRANEWAIFAKQGIQFEAKINGIGEFGQLILEERNGSISEYVFKEVEFVI